MTAMAIFLHADAALVDHLGGPAALADQLGFTGSSRVQRIQNWKYRGIPEVIRLRHREIFEAAEAQLADQANRVDAVPTVELGKAA
mgnify:CR=1 FL=1